MISRGIVHSSVSVYSVFHKSDSCQGMTSVMPKETGKIPGFNPWGFQAKYRPQKEFAESSAFSRLFSMKEF
jgi:hypothetical protein